MSDPTWLRKESQKAGHQSGIGGLIAIPVSSSGRCDFPPPRRLFGEEKLSFFPQRRLDFSRSRTKILVRVKRKPYVLAARTAAGSSVGRVGRGESAKGGGRPGPRLHKRRTRKSFPILALLRNGRSMQGKPGVSLSGRASSLPMGTGGSAGGPSAHTPFPALGCVCSPKLRDSDTP